MAHEYIATEPSWVICFSNDLTIHAYFAIQTGNEVSTGLDNMEVYTVEAEADDRYRDFDPVWKIGPFDVNVATEEDFDQLPGVGSVIAAEIVDGQPHWASVAALEEVSGISASMIAGWGDAVFWAPWTYIEPLPEPEPPAPPPEPA